MQGLPVDELSIQNGIMVTRAARSLVLVDPQGQGRAWLRAKEAPHGLAVAQLTNKNFRTVLEVRTPDYALPSVFPLFKKSRVSINLLSRLPWLVLLLCCTLNVDADRHQFEPESRVHAQDCLSSGKPMLIENVEQELDPLLDPVLERRFMRKGRQVTVQLADKEVRQHVSQYTAARRSLLWSCSKWSAAHAASMLRIEAAKALVPYLPLSEH